MKADLLAAIRMLPRYSGHGMTARYFPKGEHILTNHQLIPAKVEKVIQRVMHDSLIGSGFRSEVEWVDVTKGNLWVLHRCLRPRHLIWLANRNFVWQKWAKDKLPIYLRYKGKLIIWNGTHRLTLCCLTKRKVRARIYDLNKFAVWKKTHKATKKKGK